MGKRSPPIIDFSSVDIKDIDIDLVTRVYDCDGDVEGLLNDAGDESSPTNDLSQCEQYKGDMNGRERPFSPIICICN